MGRSRKLIAVLAALLLAATGAVLPLSAAAEESSQAEWRIAEIVIVGNEHIDEAVIREAITRMQVGEVLDVEAANEDLLSIYELGYFVDVSAGLEPIPDRPSEVRIVIQVFEFPVIRQVDIRSEVVPADVVREWLGVPEGQVLNQRAFESGLGNVQERALQEYEVYLRPAVIDIDEEAGILTVEMRTARVGEIKVQGHEKTRDFVIEREITFKPGDILRRDQVRRTIERINMLGYFNNVSAQFYEMEDPDTLGVLIEVSERKTGLASFGAGYSSQYGFIGYVEVRDDNFLGRGQQANLRWEFGSTRSSYDLGFYEPYLFGTPTSFGFNLYNQTRQLTAAGEKYSLHQVGGDVTLGRPLGEYTRGFVRYKLENWTRTPEGASAVSGSTRSVTLSTRTDTTDDRFSPTRGIRTGLSAEFAGGFLGGDTAFTKYEADLSNYIKVGSSGQTLALRAMYGTGNNLPEHERFRVGGAETVRGYDYGEFLGDRMLVFNAEYRFPITDAVQGVVFADAGRAFKAGDSISLSGLKLGYGVGVRLDTPLGVIRIDYGIGEGGGRTYFSIGPAF